MFSTVGATPGNCCGRVPVWAEPRAAATEDEPDNADHEEPCTAANMPDRRGDSMNDASDQASRFPVNRWADTVDRQAADWLTEHGATYGSCHVEDDDTRVLTWWFPRGSPHGGRGRRHRALEFRALRGDTNTWGGRVPGARERRGRRGNAVLRVRRAPHRPRGSAIGPRRGWWRLGCRISRRPPAPAVTLAPRPQG